MDSDTQAVIDRLNYWNQQFEQLMAMVRDRRTLSKDEQKLARERLRDLKDGLSAEVRDLELLGDKMTRCQSLSLLPALILAVANIRTRASTTPNLSWFDDLAGARLDITYVMRRLEKPDGK